MFSVFTALHHANTRSLIVAISCASVCGITFGLSMPLISLRLESMTGSGLIVGLNGAMAALATIIMAGFIPRLMRYIPSRLLLISSFLFASALFTLFASFQIVWVWFAIRFATACFITIVFVISESWINQIVSPDRRAFMLGVYGTALSGGFGVGGLLFTALGANNDWAFYMASIIFLFGLLPILTLSGPQAEAPDKEGSSFKSILKVASLAPAAIIAGLIFGALETLMFSILPVYGARLELNHAMIGMLVFSVAMGGITLQIPIGWIADRTGLRRTLLWLAAITTITPILIWLAGTYTPALMVLIFIQAGMAAGFYVIGLSLMGKRFTGGAIAAANAGIILAYGTGSLIAPPLAGGAMDLIGPPGLMLVLGLLSGSFMIFLLSRRPNTASDS